MRSLRQWLDEYGDSHRDSTNKILHRICVPLIVWCVIGLLWSLPTPQGLRAFGPAVNWGVIVVAAALVYYAILAVPLALGALPLLLAML